MLGVPTLKQKISPGLRSPCNLTFWMTLVTVAVGSRVVSCWANVARDVDTWEVFLYPNHPFH
jgi:hypothetical protein